MTRSPDGIQDVDRAPLAADIERDLGRDEPVTVRQEFERAVDEVGVPGVEESVEALALPEEPDIDARPERGGDADEHVYSDPVGMSALDPPDSRPRDMRLRREVVLGPTSLATKRSQTESEPDDIHAGSMTTSHSPALDEPSPALDEPSPALDEPSPALTCDQKCQVGLDSHGHRRGSAMAGLDPRGMGSLPDAHHTSARHRMQDERPVWTCPGSVDT